MLGGTGDNLPSEVGFTAEEFDEYYSLWVVWQAVDRRPTEFIAATTLPSRMLDVFVELDSILEKMRAQRAKSQNGGRV